MRIAFGFAIAFLGLSLSQTLTYAQTPAAAAPAADVSAQQAGAAAPSDQSDQDKKQGKASAVMIDPEVARLADGAVRADPANGTTVAYMPILYPSSHAANLLQLQNGDILCVWFSGSWEGSSNVGIVFSRLRKGSDRWEQTRLIDRHEGESYQNPMLFQAPDGTVYLFHTTQAAHQGESNAHVLEVVSHDNGNTWGEPKLLFDKPGAFTRHPIVVMTDGTWLLPLSYVNSKGIGKGSENNYCAMELSSDNGKTWKECVVDQSNGKVQPTVVQLGPGRLLSFFRDRAAKSIYESVSKDGCHWTPPVPTVLPNNNASVQAFRLQDGHIVIVFDNQRKGPRRPVSIALSEDEGRTWSYVRDVEAGRPELVGPQYSKIRGIEHEEYSYPSVMQSSDGMIHVAYTFRRQTIKVVSFDEDWIRKGGTMGLYHGTKSDK